MHRRVQVLIVKPPANALSSPIPIWTESKAKLDQWLDANVTSAGTIVVCTGYARTTCRLRAARCALHVVMLHVVMLHIVMLHVVMLHVEGCTLSCCTLNAARHVNSRRQTPLMPDRKCSVPVAPTV
jgi:hypothetical protein